MRKILNKTTSKAKRLIMVVALCILGITQAWAYDFSATAPSGQTLYYSINLNSTSNEVYITSPNLNEYSGYNSIGYSGYTGNLVIPASVTYNGITYSVTSIGNYAFYVCSGLTSVTIPNSVTNIGNYAFYVCSGLTSVTIPNSVTNIGDYAFANCSGLTSVTIPNSVTSVGDYAFYLVKNIVYSGTATGSPWGALTVNGYIDGDFIYSNSTKTILTAYIGSSSNVTIPNSVTSIGNYAFYVCSGLTSVTIPNSVTNIGNYAFYVCSGLTSVTIPNSVTSVGNYAFYLVKNIVYSGTATGSPWGALTVNGYIDGDFIYSNSTKTILTAYIGSSSNVTIPNSVTSIGNYAFYLCSGLTSVTIPNSVTNIGDYAFANCSGLTSVTIPNSVTSIGNYAFYVCSGLTSVTIPNSVTSVGNYAFYLVKNIVYSGTATGSPWGALTVNGYIDGDFIYSNSTKTILTAYIGSSSNVTIPNSVTSIGNYAFYLCSGLTSVIIPNSVTSIGNYAFYVCSGLTSVTIPNSVTNIGDYAFVGCSGLTSVTIGNSVTTIGNYAFHYCSGLTSVTIPNSVTSIGELAFWGCSGLTSVIIGNSVATIGNYAFYVCSGLTSVTIPNSVISIGDGAFVGCIGLREVISLATLPPTLGIGAFNSPAIAKIPCGSLSYYTSAASNWPQYFVPIEEICNNIIITVISSNENMGTVSGGGEYAFGSEVTITATPKQNHRFVSWNDGSTMNPRMVTLTRDTVFTAIFESNVQRYTITVMSSNNSMGTVSGGGTYEEGSQVTITATAAEGYHFVSWNDGNTNNPRTITVTGDATYIANFAEDVSIDVANELDALTFYPNPTSGTITFNSTDIRKVEVMDAMGRMVATFENSNIIDLSKLSNGYYALRITTDRGVVIRKVVRN